MSAAIRIDRRDKLAVSLLVIIYLVSANKPWRGFRGLSISEPAAFDAHTVHIARPFSQGPQFTVSLILDSCLGFRRIIEDAFRTHRTIWEEAKDGSFFSTTTP